MHPVHRHPVPSPQDFQLVANRYVVVPTALWALAIVAAIASTLATRTPATERTASPSDVPAPSLIAA